MRLFLGLILFLTMHISVGQLVSLPDVNLRNKLLASYPQVMTGNQLDIVKAATITVTLDLRNSNISDATGIQYFTSIPSIDLTNNQLTTIPDISGISGLASFYANNNQLTSLPDMSALTQLKDFQVMHNKLTALPDLSGATGLLTLYCTDNKITGLPPLTQFPNLINLVAGDNPFANPIDFSPCTNLKELHIHRTGTDTIIGLEKLTKLTVLYAWGNKIRDLSALDSIKTLTLCSIFNNLISDLPYLANKPGLNQLDAASCHLSFEDIIPVLLDPPATFTYSPQKAIPFNDVTARAENALTLSYPIDNPHPGNKYVWIKNGLKLDSSASPSFTFNPLTFVDSGNYVLKVYNPSVPTLILKSDTFTIVVKPCVELDLSSTSILSKECGKGYAIDLSNIVSGGTAPFTYELSSGSHKKKHHDEVIENVAAGKYEIAITDSKNCFAKGNLTLDRIGNCDPVITPNGDGIADSYFIDKPGKAKIYDLKRRLVNTLEAPVVWEGTDQNGALLDAGYYVIIMDGLNPIHISIIR